MDRRTQLDDSSHPLHEAFTCLLANGLDGAGEALRILVNEASRIERAQHLQARPYERCAQRVDHANGYKNKTMLTRMGEVTFEVLRCALAASTSAPWSAAVAPNKP
jgi:transposase-like protein